MFQVKKVFVRFGQLGLGLTSVLGVTTLAASPLAYADALGCSSPSDSSFDPDHTAWYEWADPSGLAAVYSISNYGGKGTDRNSNYGIRAYMGDSVVGDEDLYDQAADFYSRLRRIDEADHEGQSEYRKVPIQNQASTDLWALAYQAAGGDSYRAFKILALFGHDNMDQALTVTRSTNSCRVDRLNSIKPNANSNLYLNGAIGGLEYASEWVAEGVKIANDCNDPAFAGTKVEGSPYLKYCNDYSEDYQADYYHVIASAFFGCRRFVAQDKVPLRGWLMSKAENLIIDQYLGEVADYKIARFYEEMAQAETVPFRDRSDLGMARFFRANLASLSAGGGGVMPTEAEMNAYDLDIGQQKLVRALIHRQAFEVRFRKYQHRLGMEFGRQVCSQ